MTVQSGSRGGGVFAQLDNQEVGSLYIYLAVLATIGGVLFGFDSAKIGAAPVFLPFKLGPVGTGILVAGASLGSFVGALAAGPLVDRFGRKSLLLVDSGLFAVGSLVSPRPPPPPPKRRRWSPAVCSSDSRSGPTPRSRPPTSPSSRRRVAAGPSRSSSSG